MLEWAGLDSRTSRKCSNVVPGMFATLFMLLDILELRRALRTNIFARNSSKIVFKILLCFGKFGGFTWYFGGFSWIFEQKCSFSELRRSSRMPSSINSVAKMSRTTLEHFREVLESNLVHSNTSFFFFPNLQQNPGFQRWLSIIL